MGGAHLSWLQGAATQQSPELPHMPHAAAPVHRPTRAGRPAGQSTAACAPCRHRWHDTEKQALSWHAAYVDWSAVCQLLTEDASCACRPEQPALHAWHPHLKATAAFHSMAARRCACACSTYSCHAPQQAWSSSKRRWCRRTPTCEGCVEACRTCQRALLNRAEKRWLPLLLT